MGSASGASYWIATLTGSGFAGDSGYSIAVDNSGSAYVTGQVYSSVNSNDILIAKYDTSGTIQWQRTLSSSGFITDQGFGISVDSSGNAYVTGLPGSGDMLIAKYDTSGTIQWQRTLGGSGSDVGYAIAVDSSGNVYVAGTTNSQGAGNTDVLLTKYDTSGTIQWQQILGGSSFDTGSGIIVDSSGNVYVTGNTTSSGAGSDDVLITKYDTSGTIQWQRTLGGSNSDRGFAITVDSGGNLYVTGETASSGAGGSDVLITKYDTSGTIQWQRTLGGSGFDSGFGITIDSSGNVYVAGTTTSSGAGSGDILLTKYSTSGTIQWQRTLGSSGSEAGLGISIDGGGSIYVTGQTSVSGGSVLITKLPGDGSKTGTYGSFIYAASALTNSTSSLTSSTSGLTSGASSLTSSTGTLTSATSAFTSTTITL